MSLAAIGAMQLDRAVGSIGAINETATHGNDHGMSETIYNAPCARCSSIEMLAPGHSHGRK
jgi:hypothetical protein